MPPAVTEKIRFCPAAATPPAGCAESCKKLSTPKSSTRELLADATQTRTERSKPAETSGLGWRRIRFRGDRRFGFGWRIRLRVAGLDPFGHDVIFGEVADLAMQLEFVAGHLALVFHADFVVLKLHRFDKRDFVPVDLPLDDGHFIRSHLPFADGFAGDVGAVHPELKRVFWRADLRIKLRLPFPGNGFIRAPSRTGERQRARRECE